MVLPSEGKRIKTILCKYFFSKKLESDRYWKPKCSKKFWADETIIEERKIRCPNCKQELSLQSEKNPYFAD